MKTTLVALAALMITAGAFAAADDMNMNGVSLRLGMVFPLDNTLSSVNDNFSNLGLEFQSPSSFSKNTATFFAIDYYSKNIGTFGKGSCVPLTYNLRMYQHTGTTRQTYAYVGLGVAIMDFNTPSETVGIVRGGFGMNVSDHTFIEAGGTFTSTSNNNGAFNTIGFSVGYRF